MDRTERFYMIDQLLGEQRVVSFAVLRERLGVSRATVKRDLEYLRNRFNAPIVWDREQGGYRFSEAERTGGQYELPGLWFNASEIHALLTMQHLLAGLDSGGLLGPHIQPLLVRLRSLLGSADNPSGEIQKRIRILGIAARRMDLDHFAVVGSSLLRRRRLQIAYFVRTRNEIGEREVSPQRLVHYRENWYLDAWCHLRHELRSFSVDAIRSAEILDTAARNVPEKTLDEVLGSGYGIFSGRRVQWAKLRFSPQRSRWVASEQWHPRQRGSFDRDERYLLEIPYSNHRELLMDILKFGRDVEVLAPAELRRAVREELQVASRFYPD
ncbi:MAG TPA: WYL domain-containing protein [Rhodocyclaceae bacterium]|nr:WYL domain-containing protein [Rhodocyclaceae bacterium]